MQFTIFKHRWKTSSCLKRKLIKQHVLILTMCLFWQFLEHVHVLFPEDLSGVIGCHWTALAAAFPHCIIYWTKGGHHFTSFCALPKPAASGRAGIQTTVGSEAEKKSCMSVPVGGSRKTNEKVQSHSNFSQDILALSRCNAASPRQSLSLCILAAGPGHSIQKYHTWKLVLIENFYCR